MCSGAHRDDGHRDDIPYIWGVLAELKAGGLVILADAQGLPGNYVRENSVLGEEQAGVQRRRQPRPRETVAGLALRGLTDTKTDRITGAKVTKCIVSPFHDGRSIVDQGDERVDSANTRGGRRVQWPIGQQEAERPDVAAGINPINCEPTTGFNAHAGEVLSAPKVFAIYWGRDDGSPVTGMNATAQNFDAFLRAVVDSRYMDMLAQYGVGEARSSDQPGSITTRAHPRPKISRKWRSY